MKKEVSAGHDADPASLSVEPVQIHANFRVEKDLHLVDVPVWSHRIHVDGPPNVNGWEVQSTRGPHTHESGRLLLALNYEIILRILHHHVPTTLAGQHGFDIKHFGYEELVHLLLLLWISFDPCLPILNLLVIPEYFLQIKVFACIKGYLFVNQIIIGILFLLWNTVDCLGFFILIWVHLLIRMRHLLYLVLLKR